MLMELLGRHSPAPAQDITRYGDGRDALLQLCRQRLDGFREQWVRSWPDHPQEPARRR